MNRVQRGPATRRKLRKAATVHRSGLARGEKGSQKTMPAGVVCRASADASGIPGP